MKAALPSTPDILKAAFCKGRPEALREIMALCFPDIFLKMAKGTVEEQATEVFLLEHDILQNPKDFCESKEPAAIYIRNKWKQRSLFSEKKKTSFDEHHMSSKEIIVPGEETTPAPKSLPAPLQYFLSALDPLDRLFFEVKYVQLLENRNSYFLVFQFLLNSTAIGNDHLTKVLQVEPALAEPMVSDFLMDNVLKAFIAKYQPKTQLNFPEVLQQLQQKDEETKVMFKKICHSREVYVSRAFREFKDELEEYKNFSPLELALYFGNKYLHLENYMELWLRLQLDAKNDIAMEKEMKSLKLWNNNFLEKHALLRRNAIMKRANIGMKEEQKIIARFIDIQKNIDAKLKKPTTWKTV